MTPLRQSPEQGTGTTGRMPVLPREDRMTPVSDLHFLRGTTATATQYIAPSFSGMVLGAAAGDLESFNPTQGQSAPAPVQAANFSTLLDHANQQLADQTDRRAQAETAAAGLVSNALILPILKQIRRSPFGENTVFSGGNGEKMFGPQFDMQLADRIAQSPRLGIKNVLADRMMKKAPQKSAAASFRKSGIDLHG